MTSDVVKTTKTSKWLSISMIKGVVGNNENSDITDDHLTGKRTGKAKYVIGVVLPFVLTIPVALVLFYVLSGLGVQL